MTKQKILELIEKEFCFYQDRIDYWDKAFEQDWDKAANGDLSKALKLKATDFPSFRISQEYSAKIEALIELRQRIERN